MSMNRDLTYFLVFLASVLSNTLSGQFSISGSVFDKSTEEPLAFVNVIVNDSPLTGTISDVNGRFSYVSEKEITVISCSYVGYEKVTHYFEPGQKFHDLSIRMSASNYQFEEVVIKAGENPANRIIRKVIENKDKNNPEKIASFTYTSYNKVIYDFVFRDTIVSDSLLFMLNEVFQDGHVLIMESVANRKFTQPDLSEEVIQGVKVSGFKHTSFAPLATDMQPFSFYREIIPIFDINYINPISQGSLSKYWFTIEDTLYQNTDTIFVLSYKPLKGKNFEGLKGLLYINTNTYAIQNVIATPYVKGLIDINIQQQYQFVDGKQWFPAQLNFEMRMFPQGSEGLGVSANGVSYIDSVLLLPALKRKQFALDAVYMAPLANVRDTLFWRMHRNEPLNDKELKTYQVIDSLGEKYKFDGILGVAEKLAKYRIGIGLFDIDISNTLVFNRYEGLRLGLGLYTNEKLIKDFSVGGFFGYGLKDHRWKYGGDLIWTLNENREVVLKGSYQNTLFEVGHSRLQTFSKRQYDFRSWMAYRMDQVIQSNLNLIFRAGRYAKVNVSIRQAEVRPQYECQFVAPGKEALTNYQTTDISLGLRYAFKEKLIRSMGQRLELGTDYPIFSMFYTAGIKGLLEGQFSYNKIEARIEQTFYTKSLGKTKIRVDAGYIDNPIPYGQLFTGEGSYSQNISIEIKNYFQTVRLYEFLSDQYVSLLFAHSFESLLFRAGKFRPHITISQNIGWGRLSHPEYHRFVDFKTKEKGLYESGIQFDNLLKINYLNVAYLGFGLGAYCRYGPYASNQFGDNLAYKFSMTFATK